MARSTPDGDTFLSPHKEEETMSYEMNILQQLRVKVETEIYAHHGPQPDLDNNPGKSYQQLQRDANDDKKHPTTQMFKQLVDRMYSP